MSLNLCTTNTHRQNALNSFELFSRSIPEGDNTIRQQLILEVAKTIYSPGQTGYLGGKEQIRTGLPDFTKIIMPES